MNKTTYSRTYPSNKSWVLKFKTVKFLSTVVSSEDFVCFCSSVRFFEFISFALTSFSSLFLAEFLQILMIFLGGESSLRTSRMFSLEVLGTGSVSLIP